LLKQRFVKAGARKTEEKNKENVFRGGVEKKESIPTGEWGKKE